MNTPSHRLTSLQAEMLRQILATGNGQVGAVLRGTFAPALEDVEIHTAMVPLAELPARLGEESLITVSIQIDGDLPGEFLLLQPEADFERLKRVLAAALAAPKHTVNEATDYLIPNWLSDQHDMDSAAATASARATLGDLSDRLFGAYLATVYSRFHMTTFLESPTFTIPDAEQEVVRAALKKYREVAERAFLVDVNCSAGEQSFRLRLLMLAEPQGLHAMLEAFTHRD